MRRHDCIVRGLTLMGASVVFGLTLIPPSQAATPWGMLARRAIGRVEQMSQAQKGEQPGFDVATVILNADAAKVYATAVGMLRKSQVVHIVAEDAARRTVEFSNGAALRRHHGHRSRHATVAVVGGVRQSFPARTPPRTMSWMG